MKSVFLVLLFLTALLSNAQSSAKWFRNGTVKLEYHVSPLFYVFNYSSTNKAGSAGWLLVKVMYSPIARKQANRIMWIDGVTMETEVILPASYKSKSIIVLLKGKTTFWSIPMDGKKHRAWGCIPPQVIARFARKGGRIDLQKIVARVTFYTAGRKILMRVYSSSSNRARQYFKRFSSVVSAGVLTVEDIVLPRTVTPWGAINYGLFDLIKPDIRN